MPTRKDLAHIFFFFALSIFTLSPATTSAGTWTPVSSRIGESDAVVVSSPDGTIIFAKNQDKFLVPASTLKILTALTAFEYLGPGYRFITEFFMDEENNLIIKGYGDPFLVSEEIQAICRRLSLNIDEVNDLVIDSGYFEEKPFVPGASSRSLQPYDAPIGALCVNFNTVYYRKENGRFVSAEPQTPLLPSALRRISTLSSESGRILLSDSDDELILYAGELFNYFMSESGIKTSGTIRTGRVKSTDRLIYRHRSNISLRRLVSDLMEYSNNFIANQLLMAVGAEVFGAPATLEKGVRAMNTYAKQAIGIDPVIAEGSGISRKNRLSAEMFLPVLEKFEPYHELMRNEGSIYYKTGTLSGIQCRAGYVRGPDGGMYRFALLVNTPGKLADPIMDTIRRTLDADVAQKAPDNSTEGSTS